MKELKTNFKLTILLAVLLFTACKKNDAVAAKTYSDASGTYVVLSTPDWYLTRQGNGCTVNLKLAGGTNADRVTITTAGDGLQEDYNIGMQNSQFNEAVGISFSATAVPSGTFQESTTLKAYKGNDILVVTLASGDLHY